MKGDIFYRQNKKEEAKVHYEKAVKKSEAESFQKALAYNQLARFKSSIGEYKEAHSLYDKAIEIDPGHVHAWLHKSINLLDLSRDSEAYTAFLKALELDKAKSSTLIRSLMLMIKSENYAVLNNTAEGL